jgi:predicted regulator of amino acid metabolism with ACT domain
MRKLEKNTRRYFVNLFADYILSKFNKSENTIIQVTDCENFVVVNGQTISSNVLNLNELKIEFIESNKELFKSLNKESLNIIDIIKYEQEITDFPRAWITVNKSLYVNELDPISEINISSEFPYGHSLGCGRGILYYSHYIFNQMYSLLGVDKLYFHYSSDLNEDEDYRIKVISDSQVPKKLIESLVLDCFDMDLTEFKERMSDYDFTKDVTDQTLDKPYLVQDRLKDIILI